MTRLHAVLFDLDGVLFDTEPLHRKAWIATLAEFGHTVDDEFLMPWTGIPCIDLATHLEESFSPRRDRREYHSRKGEWFRRIVVDELEPFPGVPDAVRRLADIVACGFVTSNDRIDAEIMLQAAGYAEVLRVGVTYEDVSRHKPMPDPYLEGASRIGVEPSRCGVIEDSPSGIAAAVAAGMTVAGVTSSFDATQLSAAHSVHPDTLSACGRMLERLSEDRS